MRVDATSGSRTTIVSRSTLDNAGVGRSAQDVAVEADGNIIATVRDPSPAPANTHSVIRVDPNTGSFSVVSQNGQFRVLRGVEIYSITNSAPTANAGPDQQVECVTPAGTSVSLTGLGSSDPDGDTLSYLWSAPVGISFDDPGSPTPTAVFPPGITTVSLTVDDGNGGVSADETVITVVDTTPPEVACSTDTLSLWPPNGQMKTVNIQVSATDNCASPSSLQFLLVSAQSSEPDDSTGDGQTTGDTHFADGFTSVVDITSQFSYNPATESFEGSVSLRAERDGSGDGRVYTIAASVLDTSTNSATSSSIVIVPHNQRGKN